jgi:hypothetical protein
MSTPYVNKNGRECTCDLWSCEGCRQFRDDGKEFDKLDHTRKMYWLKARTARQEKDHKDLVEAIEARKLECCLQ